MKTRNTPFKLLLQIHGQYFEHLCTSLLAHVMYVYFLAVVIWQLLFKKLSVLRNSNTFFLNKSFIKIVNLNNVINMCNTDDLRYNYTVLIDLFSMFLLWTHNTTEVVQMIFNAWVDPCCDSFDIQLNPRAKLFKLYLVIIYTYKSLRVNSFLNKTASSIN